MLREVVLITIAASGTITIRLRYTSVMPSATSKPGMTLWRRRLKFMIGGLLPGLIDLVEHTAVGEVRLLRAGPAAEGLVDREERDLRELLRVLLGDFLRTRPVVVARRDVLRFVGPEVLEVRLGDFARAALVHDLVDHRDRRLRRDAHRRHHDLEAACPELLVREERFVLP